MDPKSLPIYQLEADLRRELPRHRRVVLQAPAGSGKSTQVPQMLLGGGLGGPGRIMVLQPRRLATRLLANRVAAERGGRPGGEVGFTIRFDDCSSPDTRIHFVTEGILLRQILDNPELPGIGTIIFDEFHERHVYGDVTLARALQVQQTVRPDLNIVVMSATLDTEALQRYLAPCSVLRVTGRRHPVAIEYLDRPYDPARQPVWEIAAAGVERLLAAHPEGDVLVFMPGAYEINRTIQALRARPLTASLVLLPLYGELSPREQDAALAGYDRRKVVVATNVAETSLTIEGIALVVDSGLARVARFDSRRGVNTLFVEWISRASAEQRAGRAGRTAAGHCLRLWTEREQAARPVRDIPEIKRVDPSEIILSLKAGGAGDARAFPWLDGPEEQAIQRAEMLLRDLGALDPATGDITPAGRRLAAFPVHPRYARMLLAAGRLRCVPSVALIAALMQDRGLRLSRPDEEAASDFFVLMKLWRHVRDRNYDPVTCARAGISAGAARQVEQLAGHFVRIARQQGLPATEHDPGDDAVRKAVLAGLPDQLAVCRSADAGVRCRLVHNRVGTLARDSVVRDAQLLVAADVREIERRDRETVVQLSLATAVKQEWLEELFPGDLRQRRTVLLDPTHKRVVANQETMFRDLAIAARAGEPTPTEAATLLADEIMRGRLSLDHWDDQVEQWILRLESAAAWCPELGLPPLTEADRRDLLEQICLGSFGYKEVQRRPVAPVVKSWLSAAQQAQLEKCAPERITLRNGQRAKVTYVSGGPPYIALRIQQLYGVEGEVRIAHGRVPLSIHVLAPNNRPVQITGDLTNFWRTGYPKIKRELQRRYPKHEWR